MADGTKKTEWDDGRYIDEFVKPRETATEFEKATAIERKVGFSNNTEIVTYFNGSVVENRNGSFFKFIVAPKSFYIEIKTEIY